MNHSCTRALLAASTLVLGLGFTGCGDEPGLAASGRSSDAPLTWVSPGQFRTPEKSFGDLTIRQQDALLTEALRTWQEVLAARLDPRSQHLGTEANLTYRRFTASGRTPRPYDEVPVMVSLPKLAWRNAGESGSGWVQLSVFTRWVEARYQMPCLFLETPCHRFRVASARRAFHGGFTDHPAFGDGFFVALERTDGISVVLTGSSLFGNNTPLPISGTGLTRQDLVEVALDPRIALPR